MERVLILLGAYFPLPSPNGICVEKVAAELLNKGVEVHILSNQSIGLKDEENIDGIKIYRKKNTLISRILEWCSFNEHKRYTFLLKKVVLLLNKIKNILFIPTWPLTSPVFAYGFYKKANKLNEKNRYSSIISVYAPIDALLAGYLIKKKNKDTNLIMYFLDTLPGGIAPKYFSQKWLENRGGKWENMLFKSADSIFIMEAHRNNYLNGKFAEFENKIEVLDIPLLRDIKQEVQHSETNIKNSINFVYTGSFLKRLRNPSYLLKIFSEINFETPLKLQIFGGGDCEEILNDAVNKYSSNAIELYGKVPLNKAYQKMLEADFLISVGNSYGYLIPSKIFEYMSTGKPIIHFYSDQNDASLPYLRKYPLSLIIKEDESNKEENLISINEFIEKYKGQVMDFKTVKNLFLKNSPDYTSEKILKLIEEHKKIS